MTRLWQWLRFSFESYFLQSCFDNQIRATISINHQMKKILTNLDGRYKIHRLYANRYSLSLAIKNLMTCNQVASKRASVLVSTGGAYISSSIPAGSSIIKFHLGSFSQRDNIPRNSNTVMVFLLVL